MNCLVPRLFRPEFWDPIVTAFQPKLEMSTIEDFKRHASLVSDLNLPSDDDRFGWLCVMQHYGTPTRLLDWTENALIALYFTVADARDSDGELWAMLPWALNKKADAGWGTPIPSRSRHLRYLLSEPYWSGDGLAEEVGLDKPVDCPLALRPPMMFPRMAVQSSGFTIHPLPDRGQAIEAVLADPKHLVRYIIPAEVKRDFLLQLRSLAISDGHLFPDLEGLSRMIVSDTQVIAYSPPDPPTCAGEIEKP